MIQSNSSENMKIQASGPAKKFQDHLISEHFEILEKIGSGGMSWVYRARQKLMNRIVALKVCKSTVESADRINDRFSHEARLISAVSHEHIGYVMMAAHDQETDRLYYAMELIDGPSVEEMLADKGTLDERTTLEFALAVGQALACLHENKIVHLDVKPANLIITQQGVLKLIDFGIAQRIADLNLDEKRKVEGTPLYMAPEQSGVVTDSIDGRTDLYALGCSLFHMLTGRAPYSGSSASDIMKAHVREELPRVETLKETVSAETAALIRRLMQRKKTDRFASASDLCEQIKVLLNRGKDAPKVEATPLPRLRLRRYRR